MTSLPMDDLVERFYQPLYRFALSLTRNEAAACDHVQETFYLLATKGHQLHDSAKAKGWLFTTLYRDFLKSRRRGQRLVFEEITAAEQELPVDWPDAMRTADSNTVLHALQSLEETFRVPLVLFYLEDFSYKEIAEQLEVPIGTVMSRLSRGKEQLRRLLADTATFGRDMSAYFASFMSMGKGFDFSSGSVAKINDWLRATHGFEVVLPATLAAAPALGCTVHDWHGAPTSLICLKPTGLTQLVHVFSVDRHWLNDAPGSTPSYAMTPAPDGGEPWNNATWSQGTHAYLSLTHNPASALRQLLEG